jgi:opacity protein-like surface antigen
MTKLRYAAAVACSLLAWSPADAQSPFEGPEHRTSGFVLGAYLNGTAASFEGEEQMDSGGGLTLRLGYGPSSALSVFLAGTGASMESGDYTMAHVDLGARYLLRTARLRPYVEGGVSAQNMKADLFGYTVEVRGGGPTLGGGLEYSFGRSAALDVGMSYTFGRFTRGRVVGEPWEKLEGESFSATSARFDIGMVWRP